ncbi:hypothetical protein HanRHA438_Chr07g0306791 [Helianthus annuus]|nr:hypothetical protein HanRHA438_Chr07g0306791 [Helianthus annuus]
MADQIPFLASRMMTASRVTTASSGWIRLEMSGDGILIKLMWAEPLRSCDSTGDVWVVTARMVMWRW